MEQIKIFNTNQDDADRSQALEDRVNAWLKENTNKIIIKDRAVRGADADSYPSVYIFYETTDGETL